MQDHSEDAWLSDVLGLAMINAGFKMGLWDRLRAGSVAMTELPPVFVKLASSAGLVADNHGVVVLSAPFAETLATDLDGLRARAAFLSHAIADLMDGADLLLKDPDQFRARARTFAWFRYDRALGTGAANVQDTAPWVDYVSALSRAEAPALVPLLALDGVRHLLEIGGNSGTFMRAVLQAHPTLNGTVLDLPAVCKIGAAQGAQDRLAFHPGDMRDGDWPEADAVLFKSVLHDWDAASARSILAAAAAHIPVGGRVLVLERGALGDEARVSGTVQAANVVFAQHYRDPVFYEGVLRDLGLRLAPTQAVQLDMRFHLVCAEKV